MKFSDIKPDRDASPARTRRTNSCPRLADVQAAILRSLCERSLSITKIAAECGISIRHLHALFQHSGITCCAWIWRQRIQQCHSKLLARSYADKAIGQLAAECGFRNHAHFSRRFKREFGYSPRDARMQRIGAQGLGPSPGAAAQTSGHKSSP